MAKLTQAEVKAKLDEWACKGSEIAKLEKKRDADLQPHLDSYNEAIAPVVKKHQPKIERVVQERSALEAEINAWLGSQDKAISISGELAVAANELQVGSRKIDAENFFAKVKDRSAAFWECITVAIAKAEKYLGKDKVDELSSKSSKLVATLKLK